MQIIAFFTIDLGSMSLWVYGYMGYGFSDGNIFASSHLRKQLNSNTLQLPPETTLPGQESNTPYVFVGDEAFPLSTNLMRPFSRRQVTNNYTKKVFNYR